MGTRLHAGMYALQHKRRSIILIVDQRVRSMKVSYGINCLEREDVESLDDLINSEVPTHMNIDEEAINSWLSQFEKGPVYR